MLVSFSVTAGLVSPTRKKSISMSTLPSAAFWMENLLLVLNWALSTVASKTCGLPCEKPLESGRFFTTPLVGCGICTRVATTGWLALRMAEPRKLAGSCSLPVRLPTESEEPALAGRSRVTTTAEADFSL